MAGGIGGICDLLFKIYYLKTEGGGIFGHRLRLGVISVSDFLSPVFLHQCLGVGIAHLSCGCAVDISRYRCGQETGPLNVIPEQDFSKPPCHFFGLSKM